MQEYSEFFIAIGMILYGAFLAHTRTKKRELGTTENKYTATQIKFLEVHAKKAFRLEHEAQRWRIRAEACEETLKNDQQKAA